MKNLLIVLTLSLFATTAFAQDDARGGGSSEGMSVVAVNNANDSIAVGDDTNIGTLIGDLDVTSGMAVSGSILVNPSDCGCYDSLVLRNTSTKSVALGASAAGSIVVR